MFDINIQVNLFLAPITYIPVFPNVVDIELFADDAEIKVTV